MFTITIQTERQYHDALDELRGIRKLLRTGYPWHERIYLRYFDLCVALRAYAGAVAS